MSPSDSARTHVEAEGVVVEAVFAREGDGVRVDYRIRNVGTVSRVVFDRGDRHAVLTRRQVSGDVGVPVLREQPARRATLSHVAHALPMPSPTVPPTPLARRVEPGAHVDATFVFSNWRVTTPSQVRWCIGIGVADEVRLSAPDTHGEVEVWQTDFRYAEDQQVLCTPWFDMARGTFETSR